MSALQPRRFSKLVERLRVRPGAKVRLEPDYDPAFKPGWAHKRDAKELLHAGTAGIAEYQDRLSAQGVYGMLVLLQGSDAAGKDGAIRHVMSGVNPQGVQALAELDTQYPSPAPEARKALERERKELEAEAPR
jgi:polyphosphate kinase 2 (PPK2 family)